MVEYFSAKNENLVYGRSGNSLNIAHQFNRLFYDIFITKYLFYCCHRYWATANANTNELSIEIQQKNLLRIKKL